MVGRLLEVRADAGYRTVADVDLLFDAIDAEIARLPPSQLIVTVADWRQCPVMSSAASERVLQRIVALNGRTERSSALASLGSPTAVLQFMRLIRESGLPDRKMFYDAEELIAFLSPALSAMETERLRDFLAAGARAGVSFTRVIGSKPEIASPRARAGGRG